MSYLRQVHGYWWLRRCCYRRRCLMVVHVLSLRPTNDLLATYPPLTVPQWRWWVQGKVLIDIHFILTWIWNEWMINYLKRILILFSAILGHRLQNLHWPSPYDHGLVRISNNWNVERHEQFVWEPVARDHATLVQHVAGGLHGSLLHPSFRHLVRRGAVGEYTVS